jgi:hypothetical protein
LGYIVYCIISQKSSAKIIIYSETKKILCRKKEKNVGFKVFRFSGYPVLRFSGGDRFSGF